ncbi:MAG TPA: hypothetical protein VHW04_15430 [Solirubrobacteraceae bacterium]|nr:hypothetical protein [Solirubrobacteraceae bacterium]
MGTEAASLAVMGLLHLSGVLGGGSKPFAPRPAGIAEAIISLVLAYGASALMRNPPRRRWALGSVEFAVLGFVVGLGFTVRGGDAIDLAYHATVLPLLVLTLVALLRTTTPQRSDT